MFIETIKNLKRKKGITNAQLAEITGLTLSTLDKITAGFNTNPKLDTLRAIADALDCTLDDLVADISSNEQNSVQPNLTSDSCAVAVAYENAPDHIRRSIRAMLEPYMKNNVEVSAEIMPQIGGRNVDDAIQDLAGAVDEAIQKKGIAKVG